MWHDEDPSGEPFWLSALFWVLGVLYAVTIVVNGWNAVAGLFG